LVPSPFSEFARGFGLGTTKEEDFEKLQISYKIRRPFIEGQGNFLKET